MAGGTEFGVRTLCLAAAVALCGFAAILIFAILAGDSKEVGSKSASFAVVFALFALPAAVGVHLARRRPRLILLGALTTLAAIAAFVATIAALWHGGSVFEGEGGDWKTAAVLTLISIGSGQVSLILALGRPDDSPPVAGLRWVAVIPIVTLTIIGAEDISHRGPGTGTYSVLGILYVLGVLLPPLVERATRIEDRPVQPEPHQSPE